MEVFEDLWAHGLEVPDIGLPAGASSSPLDLGLGSLEDVLEELDAMAGNQHRTPIPICPPPPKATTPKASSSKIVKRAAPLGRVPRPATAAAERDSSSTGSAVDKWFPRYVLELSPRDYAKVKRERLHLLNDAEQKELTAVRRRVRNCIYAEEKRQRRIRDKRNADATNISLLQENGALREENARLRLELAAFAGQ